MSRRKTPEEFLALLNEDKKDTNGKLKIFFGYAAGVGKTYAMLEAAQEAKNNGVDVVVGYVEPHDRSDTTKLLDGLEVLELSDINYNGLHLKEFNIDEALKRKPELILVDELAHTNVQGSRHKKRYKDIEELLTQGINVYTTVNVQHLESLNDKVEGITGIVVKERIPDSIFDEASQVELIDIEPQDLLERLKQGKIYHHQQAQRAMKNFFVMDNLVALREIALRRCADRMDLISQKNRSVQDKEIVNEHILVCLSASPSNPLIIRTAYRMANAFKAKFTAIFVETSDFNKMSDSDKDQLRNNIRLAQQLGAQIEALYGDDIAVQIAQFARISRVSKIVVGRSATSTSVFSPTSLVDKLIKQVPDINVHIIPDPNQKKYRGKKSSNSKDIGHDLLWASIILIVASIIGVIFDKLGYNSANIIMIYILGVLFISILVNYRSISLISSIMSVLMFNFLFVAPRYSLQAYRFEDVVTFVVMFSSAFITSTLALRLKNSARQSVHYAHRMTILYECSQLLQMAKNEKDISEILASQLIRLLNTNIIVYLAKDNRLTDPLLYGCGDGEISSSYYDMNEQTVARWVYKNNRHAGATTDTLSNAKSLYLSIRHNEMVYGVVAIVLDKKYLDPYENSVVLALLNQCGLAFENIKKQ